MTELQEKLLSILDYFHKLCVKENLRYYLLGGTALGAARHKGFIPWGDAVYVGMPRPDYERLRELSKDIDTGIYRFEYPCEAKDFVYPYGKLYDTTTTLIENTRYKPRRGIFLDIFPLDGAGSTHEESVENFKKIDKKVNLLATKTCAWRKGRKLYKNLACTLMRCVPEFILNSEKLKAKIGEMSSRLAYDECKYVANYCGSWHEKEISERAWFGEPVECTFESVRAFLPQDVDAYLTAIYGDWRTPPPPEKQVSHHDYLFLDLHAPYIKK